MDKPTDLAVPTKSNQPTSATPFLDRESEDYSFESEAADSHQRKKPWLRRNIKTIIFNIVMVGFYAVLFGLGFWDTECRPQNKIFSKLSFSIFTSINEYSTKG